MPSYAAQAAQRAAAANGRGGGQNKLSFRERYRMTDRSTTSTDFASKPHGAATERARPPQARAKEAFSYSDALKMNRTVTQTDFVGHRGGATRQPKPQDHNRFEGATDYATTTRFHHAPPVAAEKTQAIRPASKTYEALHFANTAPVTRTVTHSDFPGHKAQAHRQAAPKDNNRFEGKADFITSKAEHRPIRNHQPEKLVRPSTRTGETMRSPNAPGISRTVTQQDFPGYAAKSERQRAPVDHQRFEGAADFRTTTSTDLQTWQGERTQAIKLPSRAGEALKPDGANFHGHTTAKNDFLGQPAERRPNLRKNSALKPTGERSFQTTIREHYPGWSEPKPQLARGPTFHPSSAPLERETTNRVMFQAPSPTAAKAPPPRNHLTFEGAHAHNTTYRDLMSPTPAVERNQPTLTSHSTHFELTSGALIQGALD